MRAGTVKPRYRTFAELWEGLGKVPLHRIRFSPPPGAAREKDVVATWSGVDRRLCELVDGVLIEKATGTREALLAGLVLHYIWSYLEEHDIGIALGADGIVRLWRGLVRIPDVAFFSYARLPDGELPDEPIASIVPNLAVEVLSESNTRREMARKLEEYFAADVQVVWIVDRKNKSSMCSRRHVRASAWRRIRRWKGARCCRVSSCPCGACSPGDGSETEAWLQSALDELAAIWTNPITILRVWAFGTRTKG